MNESSGPDPGARRRRFSLLPSPPSLSLTSLLAPLPFSLAETTGHRGKQSRSEKKSRKAVLKLGMKAVQGVTRVTIRKSKNVSFSRRRRRPRLPPWRRPPVRPHAHQKLTTQKNPPPKNSRRPTTTQIVFVIQAPDVFKAPGSDTYIIFGEAKIEDTSAQQHAAMADQFRMLSGGGGGAAGGPGGADMAALAQMLGGAGGLGAAGLGGAGAAAPSATVIEEEGDEGDEDEGGGAAGDESGVEAKDVELVMTQANVSRAKAVKALKASDGDIVSAIMELTM